MRLTRGARVLVAAVWLLVAAVGVDAATDKERELKRLQTRIANVNAEIARDVARRDASVAELGRIESRLQALVRSIETLRVERDASQTRLADLRAQQREREALLEQEKQGLAGQMRAAFVNGRQEQLKLLLNQEDPAAVGRMSVYYRYISDYRAAQVRAVVARLDALRVTTAEVSAEMATLEQVERQRRAELAELERTRDERRELVAKIGAEIKAKGSQVRKLQEEEARLVELIRELEKVLKEFPVESQQSFAELRGKLAWPVRGGRLMADFGQPRAGQSVKWHGVLVGAERGTPVRAVARGRVAYADWLPGLGLLVVLEHSDGYLSLYGNNDTLTRETGDWLKAGDVLATVGDSGGQANAALYFEIRKGSTPVNPHRWFAKRLSEQ